MCFIPSLIEVPVREALQIVAHGAASAMPSGIKYAFVYLFEGDRLIQVER